MALNGQNTEDVPSVSATESTGAGRASMSDFLLGSTGVMRAVGVSIWKSCWITSATTGLYMRLEPAIEPGPGMFVVVRTSSASGVQVFAPRVAIHGEVLPTEPQGDGSYGVAFGFHHRRFLRRLEILVREARARLSSTLA